MNKQDFEDEYFSKTDHTLDDGNFDMISDDDFEFEEVDSKTTSKKKSALCLAKQKNENKIDSTQHTIDILDHKIKELQEMRANLLREQGDISLIPKILNDKCENVQSVQNCIELKDEEESEEDQEPDTYRFTFYEDSRQPDNLVSIIHEGVCILSGSAPSTPPHGKLNSPNALKGMTHLINSK